MRSHPGTRRPLAAALAAAAALLAAPAGATERLPGQIRSSLGLTYTPQCSLCHFKGNTGNGTVTTPFGLSARALGLTGNGGGRSGTGSGSVSSVLQQMTANGTDSDGDGVPDTVELQRETDPNVHGAVPIATSDPGYGCSQAPPALAPLLLLLAFGARGLRRRYSK